MHRAFLEGIMHSTLHAAPASHCVAPHACSMSLVSCPVPPMCCVLVQVASTSLDLNLPVDADEQSINYTLAQLIMVMERLDTQIGTTPPSTVHCLI